MGGRVDHPDLVGVVDSVNQMLPSGPAAIPKGWLGGGDRERADGVVVGLIIPIASAPVSVNQRLPSGPAVIPGAASQATAREREFGDRGDAREQATIFQPFEPEHAPPDMALMPGLAG